jgi:hypothetical protein
MYKAVVFYPLFGNLLSKQSTNLENKKLGYSYTKSKGVNISYKCVNAE